jgi:dihydrodipicolinate synthase/N-acetylneuraminate lyase
MAEEGISGTFAAAVTPLRDAGERIDEDALETLLEFYRASALDGLLVLGTTGEGILLGGAERRRVAERAITDGSPLRVIVQCGAQTTTETRALSAHAAETGADGVAVIAPPYFRLAAAELLEHFAAAAAVCAPLPFYLYEYADRTGYEIPVSVAEELRERAPNLAGMKVSDTPFERVEPYLATGLDVFIGNEGLLAQGLELGARGAVSGVAAAFPEAVSLLVRDPTPERSALVQSLRGALSRHPFQASVKAALVIRGVAIRPDVRAPLQPLSPGAAAGLRSELERVIGADGLVRL